MREPVFMSDGEVDPISHAALPAPRVPRDRVLATGGMWWFALAVGSFIYGAGYIVWGWIHS